MGLALNYINVYTPHPKMKSKTHRNHIVEFTVKAYSKLKSHVKNIFQYAIGKIVKYRIKGTISKPETMWASNTK